MKLRTKMLTAVLSVLLLCGCSGKSAANGTGNYYASPAANETAGYMDTADYYAESENGTVIPEGQKLVYTGSMTIESKEYDDTKAYLKNKTAEYGGLIEYENEYSNGYDYYGNYNSSRRSLNMTIRIPSESFYKFIEETEGSWAVTRRSTNIDNITRQYNDTAIAAEALEVQERKLLEMMEQAVSIDDMIAVESRLSEVQRDLAQLKSRLNSMDTDVAYSTLSVDLVEVVVYTEHHQSYFEQAADTFKDGISSFVEFLRNSSLTLIYLFPYLILLAALIAVYRFLKKKFGVKLPSFRRKNRKEKEKDHTIV